MKHNKFLCNILQSLDTLTRLMKNADSDMLMKSKMVQRKVTEKMSLEMCKLVQTFSKTPDNCRFVSTCMILAKITVDIECYAICVHM